MEQVLVRNKSVTWGGSRTAVLLMLLALLLPILVLAPAPPPVDMIKVQPALRALVVEQPEAVVKIIVQKQATGDAVEQQVMALGGAVTKDLHIINAFAADVPAGALADLAANSAVRWISLDGPVEDQGKGGKGGGGKPGSGDDGGSTIPPTYFLDTLNVRPVWDMGLQGQGITVAVVDSGVHNAKDLQIDPTTAQPDSRVLEQLIFNDNAQYDGDVVGHGTHVGGIIGGSGYHSGGVYAGIAPQVNLISLKVSDDNGMAYESDTVDALQWILDNKDQYNIRVVNLSINSTQEGSYHDSALNAAAEILWFNGIVVVASAGNSGTEAPIDTISAAPANDPFIITVGATDENGTSKRQDDTIPTWSADGFTMDGYWKPDIFAPGKDIISILFNGGGWGSDYPERVVEGEYFRASGTSMSAPMVSAAAALLLQDEPNLTPDQVKFRLMWAAGVINGYAYLDVYQAVTETTTASANTGLVASQLLWTGSEPITWTSVNWNSVNWNSVNWNSVNWNSVNWNSVNWNSVNWNE